MAELLPWKRSHSLVPYLFGYKTGFPLSRMTTNNQLGLWNFAII